VKGTLATDGSVSFKVSCVLVHRDVYYSVEDGERWWSGGRVGVVDGETLFVLQVGVPYRVGEEVLSYSGSASLE
jgi:endonuclease YncB( thermonuclease family)